MVSAREAQRYLSQSGFYRDLVDGDWGPSSRRAALDQLKSLGVITDGWTDMRLMVGAAQSAAHAHGINVGKIDGYEGPQTRQALLELEARRDGREVEATAWRDLVTAPPPSARPSVWPLQRDVEKFYGKPGENQVTLALPRPMFIAWNPSQKVTRFSVHEKCHDAMLRCFQRIADAYTEDQAAVLGINLFGGCLNVRKMRGGSAMSMHSWGIAIDFDPARNQLKWGRDRARLARPDGETFWRIWEDEGFVSLGRLKNFDWMHVQAARLS